MAGLKGCGADGFREFGGVISKRGTKPSHRLGKGDRPPAAGAACCPSSEDEGADAPSKVSESVVVLQHENSRDDDLDIAPQGPARNIFEIRLEPVGQVLLLFGRAAVAADLGEAGEAGLEAVSLPVLRVHYLSNQPVDTVPRVARVVAISLLTVVSTHIRELWKVVPG